MTDIVCLSVPWSQLTINSSMTTMTTKTAMTAVTTETAIYIKIQIEIYNQIVTWRALTILGMF